MSQETAGGVARRAEAEGYGPGRRALHWATAVLIFGLFPAGWVMTRLGDDAADLKYALYDWHKWFGMVALGFVLARIVLRRLHPVPDDPDLTAFERRASHAAHLALYVLMVAVPLAGWAGSSALGFPVVLFGVLPLPDWVPEDRDLGFRLLALHSAMTYALAAVIAIHVAGALYHALVKRDGVLRRMTSGRREGGVSRRPGGT